MGNFPDVPVHLTVCHGLTRLHSNDIHPFTTSRIDHVFVTPDVHVEKYGVLTDTYRTPEEDDVDVKPGDAPAELKMKRYKARVPSDHFPVLVRVELK